jgi:nucleotide-binding universal stress UspA family protein
MTMKKLLVPVDGSEGSKRALEIALDLAAAANSALTLLQVIEPDDPLPTISDQPPAGVDRVTFLAERRFAPLRSTLEQRGVAFERRVAEGVVPREICRVAADEGTDIIIIGSRGLSPMGRLLLGSVSDYVAKHAPCSVLVARHPAGHA